MPVMEFSAELKSINNILVVGPAWIGDMMMAQSLFKLLKLRNPKVKIDVLASGWTRLLLAHMPEVNDIIDMPLGHGALDLKVRYGLGKALAGKGYQQAILLPNSFKSAFIPFFAKIPLRTGWRGEMRYGLLNDMRVLDKQYYPLMVQRYMALAFPAGAPVLEQFPYPELIVGDANRVALLEKFSLRLDRPLLILCPGAEYGPSKRWPERYYAEVAAEKICAGWQVWLMGSVKDQPVVDAIRAHLPAVGREYSYSLAGVTSLGEAIVLMHCADAVISNDSGLMHIAAALKKPLIAVYGSTSAAFTPPLAERVKIVSNKVECAPCFERECFKLHHKCMQDLLPIQVLTALDALLPTAIAVGEM